MSEMRDQTNARIGRLACALLALLVSASAALGASVSLRAPREGVYAGDRFEVRLVVSGEGDVDSIDLSAWEPLEPRAGGTSTYQQIVNGRRSRRTEYAYSLRAPADERAMRLPAISVRVDGQEVRTEPRWIALEQPKRSPHFQTRLTIEDESPFVGEPVRIRLTFYLDREIQQAAFDIPGLEGRFDLYDPPLSELRRRAGGSDSLREASLSGREVAAVIGAGELNGRRMPTVTIEQILIPREPGPFEIGPATVAGEEVVDRQRVRRRSFFDDGYEAVTERFIAQSEPLTIEVRPLPEEGRPIGFDGLVGDYSVEAESEASAAKVGEPIPLTVRIVGPPPIERVAPPDLEEQPAFAERFKVSRTPDEGAVVRRGSLEAREFSFTLRARSDEVDGVPPIELVHFDPDSERYEVARSEALPLMVEPTRRVTLDDAVTNAPIEGDRRGEALEDATGGLAPPYAGEQALRPAFSIARTLRDPVWIAVAGGPAAGYALALVVGGARRRLRAGPGAERRRTFAEARRTLRDADSEGAQRAVLRCIGACVGRPGESMTAGEAEEALRSIDAASAPEAGDLLRRCERARYAGTGAEDASLRSEAGSLLDRLEKEARS